MRLPAPLALLVAAGLILILAPSAQAAIAYGPCAGQPALQCGGLVVPLDRSGAVGGAVRLSVVRKLAPANPTRTAVIGLVGGPGGAAKPFATEFARLLAPALGARDLVMFDPRGVGESGPVSCSFVGVSETAIGQLCAQRLGATRGLYTTAATVEDIESLRVADGYEKLVLFGVSYGTKVALDYAARHPDRVEALVLDSVVLPEGEDPLQRPAFAAMRRILTQLCAGSECRGITGTVVGDLASRVRSLARRPLRGYLTSPRGVRLRGSIDRRDVYSVVMGGDRNPSLRAELPAALTSARKGDSAPLIRLWARSADIISLQRKQATDDEFSDTIFAATICEEGLFPWDRAAGLTVRAQQVNAVARSLGAAAFNPFDTGTALGTGNINLCAGWPVASPAYAPAGPLPNVPTLVINGTSDIRTPLEDAAKVKALIPAAQVLAVPHTGHSALASDLSNEGCAVRAVGQFFAGLPVTPCAAFANPFSPTQVAPTSFAKLKPTGRGGKIGKTITAALRTAQDMRRQVIGDAISAGRLPRRAGGLRGGRVVVSNGRIKLLNVVFVPGVKVSGTVPVDGSRQTLRISGSKAARGRLVVGTTTITGVLGGRRIALRARAAGVAAGSREPSLDALLRDFRARSIR